MGIARTLHSRRGSMAGFVAFAVEDLAVIGIPDPDTRFGPNTKFAVVTLGLGLEVVGNGLFDGRFIFGGHKSENVVDISRRFFAVIAQIGKNPVEAEYDLAGEQVVFPQIEPATFERQVESSLVERLFVHIFGLAARDRGSP